MSIATACHADCREKLQRMDKVIDYLQSAFIYGNDRWQDVRYLNKVWHKAVRFHNLGNDCVCQIEIDKGFKYVRKVYPAIVKELSYVWYKHLHRNRLIKVAGQPGGGFSQNSDNI